jgi:hypothetical protein
MFEVPGDSHRRLVFAHLTPSEDVNVQPESVKEWLEFDRTSHGTERGIGGIAYNVVRFIVKLFFVALNVHLRQ